MNMLIASGSLLFILQGGGSGAFGLLPFVLILGIFYFLILRPQQKKARLAQQERDQMLNALKPNDKVITSGGIYGTIIAVKENTVQLRIAQAVSVEVERSAITRPQGSEMKEVEPAK